MNTFASKLGIMVLTAATAFAPMSISAAQARDGRWIRQGYENSIPLDIYTGRRNLREQSQYQPPLVYRHHRNNYVYRHDNRDAIALGIIGLGVGAIIGGAIANSNARVIYQQPPAPRARAVSGRGLEPWTRSWMRYCSNKYRSFNPSTGTYRGYDGEDHFCVAN